MYEAGEMIKYESNKQGVNIMQQAYGFGKKVLNHPAIFAVWDPIVPW